MGFWLKKAVSFWLMPLPLCLLLLVVGAVLLWRERRARLGRWLITLAALLLLLFSNKRVSEWLVQPLESAYPPQPEFTAAAPVPPRLAACRYVVVLGGGHGDAPGFPALSRLSTSALGRLAEGVRLLRAVPSARLVVSGGGAPGQPTHAETLARAAESLGIAADRILRLDQPRDTEDEAIELQRLIGHEPFALVTSATHMRRAVALMRRAGLDPLPCPTDFTTRPGRRLGAWDYLWDLESLGRSTWAVYERLGYLWAHLRGKA